MSWEEAQERQCDHGI